MAELTPAEVYSPRLIQVWRSLLNWLAFFFQIFAQIIRSVGQYPLLSSSSSSMTTSTSTHRFKPLPIVDSTEIESTASVEIASVLDSPILTDEDRIEKLAVVLDLDGTLVCAYETSSLPPALRKQAINAGLKWFELECVSPDKVLMNDWLIIYLSDDIYMIEALCHSNTLSSLKECEGKLLRSIMSQYLSDLVCKNF